MTNKDIYPLTGTMFVMGITAIVYGIYSSSAFIVLQGLYLLWLAITTTLQVIEAQRLET